MRGRVVGMPCLYGQQEGGSPLVVTLDHGFVVERLNVLEGAASASAPGGWNRCNRLLPLRLFLKLVKATSQTYRLK